VLRRPKGTRPAPAEGVRGEALLCVANFPANTGYAWDFIESLYAQVADQLAKRGVETFVAYPELARAPETLAGTSARAIELDLTAGGVGQLLKVLSFVRRNRVRAVYLCDRSAWHPSYLAMKLAGVRRIVLHDHTSGERTAPRGLKALLKRARQQIPATNADVVIAVSDFVAERKAATELIARRRISRVWNSLPDPKVPADARARLRQAFGIRDDRAVIACACRATSEKGVATLLRAFDQAMRSLSPNQAGATLIYFGDGPAMGDLERLREALEHRADVVLAGYRAEAADLLAGADICVVPSLWQEAFGLAALEPMLRGIPVIASRAGGLPEVVGEDAGVLVEPGNEAMLAAAITELLSNGEARRRMGTKGRERALRLFNRETQINQLCAIIEGAFT